MDRALTARYEDLKRATDRLCTIARRPDNPPIIRSQRLKSNAHVAVRSMLEQPSPTCIYFRLAPKIGFVQYDK